MLFEVEIVVTLEGTWLGVGGRGLEEFYVLFSLVVTWVCSVCEMYCKIWVIFCMYVTL